MSHTLLADGTIDLREREAALAVEGRFATNEYGETEFDADVDQLKVDF